MCFIRLCPLPWQHLSVLPWCPPSILSSNELSPCLLKGVLESWFYINSMFGRDAHIYAYHWHLVWLHALNLSSVLYYHHVYARGRLSETMILSPSFSHKKFSSYFMLFYFQYLMAATLFFKMPLVRTPSVEWYSKRSFPTRVTRGYYRTLGEAWGWFLFLALQTTCNSEQTTLRPQLTVVVVKHEQLARLTKLKETVRTWFLVIFRFKELKVK
jgi:hypothetical protein